MPYPVVRSVARLPKAAAVVALISLAIVAATSTTAAPPDHPASKAARAQGHEWAAQGRERGPQRVSRERLIKLASERIEHAAPEPIRTEGVGPGNLNWESIGPTHMTGEFWSGGANVAGRVTCVAPHPSNPMTVYATAAQGGLWRSTDQGATWSALTDGLPSLSSGWVAIDPLSSTLWYATGEQHYCGDCFYGEGVWRSTDSGVNWSQRGTASQVGSYISRVVLQPGSSSTLLVASDLGVVRSTNGGVNWSVRLASGWCNDLVFDPSNASVAYCAVQAAGIYKSTNGGSTWTWLGFGSGLPTGGGYDRINLAISPSSPQTLYAGYTQFNGHLFAMYKTTDGGASWTQLPNTPDYPGGQGWYDHTIAVHPANPDHVFAGGMYPYVPGTYGVIRSLDGGANWIDITASPSGIVHPDQHSLAFGIDGTLWLGNDGGVWRSTNNGDDWINCNTGLPIAQLYAIATDPRTANHVLGGTQDNGSLRWTGTSIWPVIFGGDGGSALIPLYPVDRSYTTTNEMGTIARWDAGTFLDAYAGPWVGVDPVDWGNAPLIEDQYGANSLLLGTNRVWRSPDGESWSAVSGDLSASGGVLRSIAIAGLLTQPPPPPGPHPRLYASSSDGALSYSTDAGNNWIRRDPPAGSNPIPDIVPNPCENGEVFVCVDRASGGRVYHTTDFGVSWTNATGDLPAGRRVMSLAAEFRNCPGYGSLPTFLYAGTDAGVYVSRNAGTTWTKATLGLPNVAVYDLVAETYLASTGEQRDRLLAATHGRGVYRAALDTQPPGLVLTYPNGTENVPIGGSLSIAWQGSDASPPVNMLVLLSRDGGSTYPESLATGIVTMGTTFGYTIPWTATGPPTNNARVQVKATDALGNVNPATFSPGFRIYDPADAVAGDVPDRFALGRPSPNPGRVPVGLDFAVPRAAAVEVSVLSVDGRLVRRLASGSHVPGRHRLAWDGRDESGSPVGSGIYFVRLNTPGYRIAHRLALLK